jgi:hypothetical protein
MTASLCVHGQITALTVCHDSRTILVGCEDGTLLSYVIIDLPTDSDCHQIILQGLGTRQSITSNGRRPSTVSGCGLSRAWDKVDRVTGSAPPYSRPPSAVLPSGPSDKLALGLARSSWTDSEGNSQQQQHLGGRRASSSQLYRLNSCRSQACVVMWPLTACALLSVVPRYYSRCFQTALFLPAVHLQRLTKTSFTAEKWIFSSAVKFQTTPIIVENSQTNRLPSKHVDIFIQF